MDTEAYLSINPKKANLNQLPPSQGWGGSCYGCIIGSLSLVIIISQSENYFKIQ